MHLATLLSLAATTLSAMHASPCARGTVASIDQIITQSPAFDFEECMGQAVQGGNVSVVRFLFNSGYHTFDWNRVNGCANNVRPISHALVTVRGAIYDEKVESDQFISEDVEEDFAYICSFDNVLALRGLLSNPVKKAYIQEHAAELAKVIAVKKLTPRMLFFMTNEPACQSIVQSPEVLEAIEQKLNKTDSFFHVTYAHVLEKIKKNLL